MRAALSGIHWVPVAPPVALDSTFPPKGVWSGPGLNPTAASTPVSMVTVCTATEEEEEEGPASEEVELPRGRGWGWEDEEEGGVAVELE